MKENCSIQLINQQEISVDDIVQRQNEEIIPNELIANMIGPTDKSIGIKNDQEQIAISETSPTEIFSGLSKQIRDIGKSANEAIKNPAGFSDDAEEIHEIIQIQNENPPVIIFESKSYFTDINKLTPDEQVELGRS